ncbi:hypothetical protein [Prevotella sp. kh1p2]|uniref:hypothetical protein n=1 Tax=Prevotella sp. kh1p2 TaxID=1761883 RepID=UPI0008D3696F|nr:hypothetical protein [Prevotella sp. kh1p2]SES88687.1 hypothetical protein SAMN04487825_10728 [Prevotella sp. kh1p2]SNU11663.1 hypothetical protein SAMN06298210_11284 [Prevotellaceae bacterium KH2P17]
MSNFFEELKKRLQVWHEERAARIEDRRQAELDAEARVAVQVMEYGGELFACVNGIPLFGVSDLKGTLPEAVAHARRNYKDWKEEKLWERNGTTRVSTVS